MLAFAGRHERAVELELQRVTVHHAKDHVQRQRARPALGNAEKRACRIASKSIAEHMQQKRRTEHWAKKLLTPPNGDLHKSIIARSAMQTSL